MMHKQHGSTLFSFLIFLLGVIVGVVAAAVVAFYVTKAPIPLVEKYIQPGELRARADWNPNQMLQQADTAQSSSGQSSDGRNTQYPQGEEPVPIATLSGQTRERVEPSTTNSPEARTNNAAQLQYFVQAGAFSSSADAEQQRARLVLLLGTQATVSEVSAAGKIVHRVRLGPYATREAASIAQKNLAGNGVDAAIVSEPVP